MIQIIYGAKGTGKTKKIIDQANGSIGSVKGDIVFLAATSRYRTDILPQIRFIDTMETGINNKDNFLGFVKGLLCGNYDIEYVYIDGIVKMLGEELDSAEMAEAILVLDNLSKSVNIVLTISSPKETLPKFLAKYAE